jgi:hypothetical protein
MRTTINLEEDVLRAVKSLARDRGVSLGTAISDLVRQALRPPERTIYEMDFPVFEVREGTPLLTPEMVKSALEDD